MRGRKRRRAPARLSESLASWWLQARGHAIVARNSRVAGVEVDLIATKGPWTLVVEVKARRHRPGQPLPGPHDLLSQDQLRRLRRVLGALERDGRLVRLDLIAVSWRGAWPRLRRWTDLKPRSEVG